MNCLKILETQKIQHNHHETFWKNCLLTEQELEQVFKYKVDEIKDSKFVVGEEMM